jgi:hypothetical protein
MCTEAGTEWSMKKIEEVIAVVCGLRRGSSAACLLGLWVRIPPGS